MSSASITLLRTDSPLLSSGFRGISTSRKFRTPLSLASCRGDVYAMRLGGCPSRDCGACGWLIFGFGLGEIEAPPKVDVDSHNLFQKFYDGFDQFKEILESVLSREVYKKLLEIKGMKERVFTFPTDLWARILYDMAVGYRNNQCDLGLMMDSLIPLYFGRTFSFVKKTKRMSILHAEEAIEEDCVIFEMSKPYLVNRWMEK